MFKNHLKLSFRSLVKNKLFTAIKLTGLTVGITACLLIGLYLHHELAYDAFHEKADRIVRVVMAYRTDGETQEVGVTGNKVVPSFRRDFPEVESGVRINLFTQVVKYGDKLFEEEAFYFADSTFFEIFSFPLLAGNPKTALHAPKQVVLTESMAKKYFGASDPMGKTLSVGASGDYVVTGVMADPPSNSQLKPGFIGSLVGLRDMTPERATWWNANYGAYLLLRAPGAKETMQAKIPAYMKQFAGELNLSGDAALSYKLEPLRDVHLRSAVANKFEPNGDIRYLYILGAVGLFILLISGITYVNLSTAVGADRAREVGVQKVLGAGRMQLFWQHIGEAGILTGIALAFSYALTAPLLPLFGRLLDRPLEFATLFQPAAVLALLAFGAVTGLLAGAWPALVISQFQPVKVLKGQFKSSASGIWLRKSLIVLQFSISVLLIISTIVLQQQLHFIQHKKLGFDKEQVLALATDQTIVDKLESIKSVLLQNNNIRSASLVYETPVHIEGGYGIDKSASGGNWSAVQALPADEDFIRTMNIKMVAGKELGRADVELVRRRQKGLDTLSAFPILINETQARLFNWTPEEAVGKLVNFQGPSEIKGVMQDFHFSSLHEPIGNLVVFPDTWGQTLLVKISGNDLPGTLQFIENKWTALAPHRPFSYHFLDEEYDKMYRTEIQTARLVSTFSGLAIFLACLGLFGLATYSIVQRTKEIGIRKVLGASVAGIVGLLSKDFVRLVAVALVLAAPVAWLLLNQWLADFSYRIELQWWVFAAAGLIAVGIAFLTVSVQSVRAALNNPVESLRSE